MVSQTLETIGGVDTNHSQIQIRNLYKSFNREGRENEVLRDISFNVGSGEFISLLGPSGCGKSTLLKIMGALIPKSSGSIQIDNEEVKDPIPKVGFMFQKAVLLPWRTVEQNLLLPIELANGNLDEARKRIKELLTLVGLEGYENYYPKELSGGMQQRISLARTLITNPDILLLDEPFGALDEFTRENLNFSLMDIAEKSGKTIILVTHSISEAVLMSDRIIVMGINPGHILEDLKIDFPKPRSVQIIATEKYAQYMLHIRDLLGVGRV